MRFRVTLLALVLALGLGGTVWLQERRDRQAATERAALARLLPVQPAEVVRLGFAHGDSRIALERRESGWVLVAPVSANCEAEVVASFLDTLAAARVEDNVGKGDLVRYGLDHPAVLARIETRGGPPTSCAAGGSIPCRPSSTCKSMRATRCSSPPRRCSPGRSPAPSAGATSA